MSHSKAWVLAVTHDWHEQYEQLVRTQVPRSVTLAYEPLEHASCLAWVDHVNLYDAGVQFRVNLICTEAVQRSVGHLLHMYRWNEDDVSDIEVSFTVDGLIEVSAAVNSAPSLPEIDLIHAIGGNALPCRTSSLWWLPKIPRESLEARVIWTREKFEQSLVLDARDWFASARSISRLHGG